MASRWSARRRRRLRSTCAPAPTRSRSGRSWRSGSPVMFQAGPCGSSLILYQQDGNVVLAASVEREIDQAVGGLLDRRFREQRRADRLVVDGAVKPVAAQQQHFVGL